jgi:RNA polymerase sigma factor for flagellar operon FliA
LTHGAPLSGGKEQYADAHARRAALEQLVKAYSHLVEYVVHRIMVDLPASVDRADLVSEGKIGLIEAINRYDPERNVKFETFATWRIRGAVLDYLRKLDWSPRSLRKRAREIGAVQDSLTKKLGRPAFDEEVAKELGISESEYRDSLSKISALSVAGFSDLDERTAASFEDKGRTPEESASEEHFLANLAAAIKKLPEREKLVLDLYYSKELSLKEIGAILDLSESRICQIHGSAVIRLRSALADWTGGAAGK